MKWLYDFGIILAVIIVGVALSKPWYIVLVAWIIFWILMGLRDDFIRSSHQTRRRY